MPRPDKVIKGTGKAVGRIFDKTSTRVADARTKLLAGSSDGKSLAQDTVGQGLDMIQVALDLVRAFADRPPTAFIDIQTPGGGGTGSPNTTATLDDPVGTIGLLQVTPLVSPGIGSTLTMGVTALGTDGADRADHHHRHGAEQPSAGPLQRLHLFGTGRPGGGAGNGVGARRWV